MSQQNCSCEKFERLEGASVPAYINAFLEDLGRNDPTHKNEFRCRVCGRRWEKRAPDERLGQARAALVRVDE